MQTFQYSRPATLDQAVHGGAKSKTAQQYADVRFVAGGTTLVDLMKLDVEQPRLLIDINALPLERIDPASDGRLVIGALARNSTVAHHPVIQRDYPVLSQALLSGASPQLRNMATTAGNLLQRTRCMYFRDTAHACNKREPGTGCSAIGGHNRTLAILGTSKDCIATNPSDQNVALTALEATIQVQGVRGKRSIPIQEFYLKPGSTPDRENVLEPGDLIVSVTLPAAIADSRSHYLKLRDRAAYEFALASAAIIVKMKGNRMEYARVALGGVGTVPWRFSRSRARLARRTSGRCDFSPSGGSGIEGRAARERERIQGRAREALHRACTHCVHAVYIALNREGCDAVAVEGNPDDVRRAG